MFRLEGTFQFDFVSYGTERDLNQVIENYNLFLAAANKFDLEAIFTEYEMEFRNLNLIDQECVNNLRQIFDNETALSASKRLSLQADITQRQLSLVFPMCSSYYFIKSRLDNPFDEKKTKC